MKKQEKEVNWVDVIFITLCIIALAMAAILITETAIKSYNVVTPRQPGVYVPINGDNLAVVVLDMNNTYQKQLVGANQKAFAEITKLTGG